MTASSTSSLMPALNVLIPLARSPISFFAVSSGNPCIDPDTSSTKMYSRGGMSDAATRAGGCAITRKKFSSWPWKSRTPDAICSAASR